MKNVCSNSPRDLLEHAPRFIRHFFVRVALLHGVDFSLAEFLFDGVEACYVMVSGCV